MTQSRPETVVGEERATGPTDVPARRAGPSSLASPY